jgi:restriction endonuclease S subunit
MSLIPTEEQSELNAIISILQSKIKKLETENEELKQVKNIAYEPMLAKSEDLQRRKLLIGYEKAVYTEIDWLVYGRDRIKNVDAYLANL